VGFWRGLATIIAASFLMQAGVQGAWGVIPVHLTSFPQTRREA